MPCKKCRKGVDAKYASLKGLGKNTIFAIEKLLSTTNTLRQNGIDFYSPEAFDTIIIEQIKFIQFAQATATLDKNLDQNNIHELPLMI